MYMRNRSDDYGTPFKYEYRCIDKNDNVVSEGEFILRLACTIRSSRIREAGIFAVFDNDREKLSAYRGLNHLKRIDMTVTNTVTNSVRHF